MILGLFQYNDAFLPSWDSHYKDKTVSQPSYLYNGNRLTWKDGLYVEMGPAWLEYQTSLCSQTSGVMFQMLMEPLGCKSTKLLLQTLSRCISSPDRFEVVRGEYWHNNGAPRRDQLILFFRFFPMIRPASSQNDSFWDDAVLTVAESVKAALHLSSSL